MEDNQLEIDIRNFEHRYYPLDLKVPADAAEELKEILNVEGITRNSSVEVLIYDSFGIGVLGLTQVIKEEPKTGSKICRYILTGTAKANVGNFEKAVKGYDLACDTYARFMGADLEYPDVPLPGPWTVLPSPPIGDSATRSVGSSVYHRTSLRRPNAPT